MKNKLPENQEQEKEPAIGHIVFGKEFYDFSPKNQTREHLLNKIKTIFPQLPSSIETIYSPKVNFTTKIADVNEGKEAWAPIFSRTKDFADGVTILDKKIAVGIFNGDCPLICLYNKNSLTVLHGGYRCLIRENSEEKGLIEVAMQNLDPNTTKALIFGGIWPCCWVPEEDKLEILNPGLCRYPDVLSECLSKTTSVSPFKAGHDSVDLYKLSKELLIYQGVPEKNIEINNQCTCCAKNKDGYPLYWSHTRFLSGKEKVDGRNLTAVWQM